MIYLLFFLMGLGAVAYIGAPFWKRGPAPAYSGDLGHDAADFQTLGERRDNLLRQLKELEFDRKMGKTEGEEYSLLRQELSVEAAAVLQQLETIQPHGQDFSSGAAALPAAHMSTHVADNGADSRAAILDGTASDTIYNRDIEMEIETEVLVARARTRIRVAKRDVATDETKAIANAANGMEHSTFCTACGHRMNADDRFCARCGQRRAGVALPVPP